MDHDILGDFDVRLPEQRPIVFASAPRDRHEPESGLKSTSAHGRIARISGELIQDIVDPMEERSVLRVRTCLESRQRLIRDFVEVQVSHVGGGPSVTDLPDWW